MNAAVGAALSNLDLRICDRELCAPMYARRGLCRHASARPSERAARLRNRVLPGRSLSLVPQKASRAICPLLEARIEQHPEVRVFRTLSVSFARDLPAVVRLEDLTTLRRAARPQPGTSFERRGHLLTRSPLPRARIHPNRVAVYSAGMSGRVACMVSGKVLVVRGAGEAVELESPYAEQIGARERAIERRNAWKTQGTGATFMGRGGGPLWGERERDLPPARIVGLSRGRVENELCYSVSSGVVSGLFAQEPGTRNEQRLHHNADAAVTEIHLSVEHETVACTVQGKGGTSAIAILADDGRGVRTITEGDVVDRAPRWVPALRKQIVYSSAGVGRTRSGAFAGLGPFAIHRLNLDDGSIEVLMADAKYDYLAPVPTSENEVYVIRRPYRDPRPRVSVFGVLLDTLLVPFRLLFALFQYLSFFAARYTGKPLITSGNAQQKAADAERMMIWGNLIDVAADADKAADSDAQLSKGYELVRITPRKSEVIARGVIAFDVYGDEIAYSNGNAVFRMPVKGGSAEQVAAVKWAEGVVIC